MWLNTNILLMKLVVCNNLHYDIQELSLANDIAQSPNNQHLINLLFISNLTAKKPNGSSFREKRRKDKSSRLSSRNSRIVFFFFRHFHHLCFCKCVCYIYQALHTCILSILLMDFDKIRIRKWCSCKPVSTVWRKNMVFFSMWRLLLN